MSNTKKFITSALHGVVCGGAGLAYVKYAPDDLDRALATAFVVLIAGIAAAIFEQATRP